VEHRQQSQTPKTFENNKTHQKAGAFLVVLRFATIEDNHKHQKHMKTTKSQKKEGALPVVLENE